MSKEVIESAQANPAWKQALEALPDPGVGKKLIVYIRASSVRLHVVDELSTIKEQEGKPGGAEE